MIEIKKSHLGEYFLRWEYISRENKSLKRTESIRTYLVIKDNKRIDSFLFYENALKCVKNLKTKNRPKEENPPQG